MNRLEPEVDDELMAIVEYALDQHARRNGEEPVLAYEHGRHRRLVRLPIEDAPSTAAAEALDDRRPFQRAVVVWRTVLDMPDGVTVPVRYARAQVRGEPTSSLFVQHYSAGERVGAPALLERGAPLSRKVTGRAVADLVIGVAGGALAGGAAARQALWMAEAIAPVSVHDATVAGPAADGSVQAETVDGETIDISGTGSDLLGPAFTPGANVQILVSDITGRPTEVLTAAGEVDLVAAAWPGTVFAFVVMMAALLGVGLLSRELRPQWMWLAAGISFIGHAAVIVAF